MNKKKILLVAGVIIVFAIALFSWVYFGLTGIQESHVEGGVPEESSFNDYLSRDLSAYFTKKIGAKVNIDFELLRDEPAQAGLGAPKFYVWVYVKDSISGKTVDSGVVKVGANNKESFTVMSYVSKDKIKTNTEKLNDLFPEDIAAKIVKEFLY